MDLDKLNFLPAGTKTDLNLMMKEKNGKLLRKEKQQKQCI